ncbi:unnamed protein product [Bemisia tabaci]|uniref:Ionotropic receptor n=1 Tax=Bemisia tabaci TaxID=7038 RepID=A0A9P0F0J0_BEMTA|nr:unnamed protein product [Bemisia tabaci]
MQTIIGNPHSLKYHIENSHPKNMVFFVESLSDILSIILNSVIESNSDAEKYILYCSNSTRSANDIGAERISRLNTSESCVKIGSVNVRSNDFNSSSGPPLLIEDFELEHGSIISDDLYEATRQLYSHNIWSTRNYLVFFVSDFKAKHNHDRVNTCFDKNTLSAMNQNSCGHFDDLRVVFKFFWRFFKGLKSVVCSAEICFSYNSFADEIVHYTGLRGERYFNFSWLNYEERMFQIVIPRNRLTKKHDLFLYWDVLWYHILMEIIESIATQRNCRIMPPADNVIDESIQEIGEFPIAQKFGVDVVITIRGIGVAELDFSQYEFTTSMESYQLCLVVPPAKFVPQSLVVFYSFSITIWTLILVVVLAFICVLFAFLKMQVLAFSSFYNEVTLRSFDTESAVFTVYAYFLCGNPPRLLLGAFLTGKFIFLLFSFATIILVTAFQSSMYTMLSNYVNYPEVDTLEDFARTDLVIQVPDTDSYSKLFEAVPLLQNERRLSDTYFFLISNIMHVVYEDWDKWVDLFNIDFQNPASASDIDPNILNKSVEIDKFIAATVGSDAFLVNIPPKIFASRDLELQSFLRVNSWFKVHLVEECLNTYSLAFRFPMNNFFYDAVNQRIVQMLESGLIRRWMDEYFARGSIDFRESRVVSDAQSLRPFTLNDLAFAFFALAIGLTLSCFVFVTELCTDLKGRNYVDSMFRMLSNYVRYPEIDTLEELAQTAHVIQTPKASETESYSKFLQNVPSLENEIGRLSESYVFLESVLYAPIGKGEELWIQIINISKSEGLEESPRSEQNPFVTRKTAEFKNLYLLPSKMMHFL